MTERVGRYTLRLRSRPAIAGYAAAVGKKEGEGPLAAEFDRIFEDNTLGEESWEKAESALLNTAVQLAVQKAGFTPDLLDYVFAGDLLNQSIGATFALRDLSVPFVGLFGACSTMALSLGMAAIFVDTISAARCVAATSSHFCSAERQFRFPLEYGGQRTPTAQWTVTGAGAALVGNTGGGPFVESVTFGKMVDLGIKDANNMGAAMAPAAADTLKTYFSDTGTSPADYDMVLTGDLGETGSRLLRDLLGREGYDLLNRHRDCGLLIFDCEKQKTGAGGSGCGCSASVLCSYVFERLRRGNLKNVLFIATGALMSPTSSQQGESIPGVAHAVCLRANRG
ncbi:MAG: stage V sporulation protein AD [Oscillospiraceae bacterium]|jgi:stage V sporulation protein AD|nr:stage V sporulation protein AD [Oscillospiraceae bacterium]